MLILHFQDNRNLILQMTIFFLVNVNILYLVWGSCVDISIQSVSTWEKEIHVWYFILACITCMYMQSYVSYDADILRNASWGVLSWQPQTEMIIIPLGDKTLKYDYHKSIQFWQKHFTWHMTIISQYFAHIICSVKIVKWKKITMPFTIFCKPFPYSYFCFCWLNHI